jgi:hypothetical protein
MIRSDRARITGRPQWALTLPVAARKTIDDLPGFVVLAAGEYGGELELLVETATAEVYCDRRGTRAVGTTGMSICCAMCRWPGGRRCWCGGSGSGAARTGAAVRT